MEINQVRSLHDLKPVTIDYLANPFATEYAEYCLDHEEDEEVAKQM